MVRHLFVDCFGLAVCFGLLMACSPAPVPVNHAPKPESAPEPPTAPVVEKSEPAPDEVAEPDPKRTAEAERRYGRGREMFRQGRYDEAEVELKEALNLYPFMAPANLVLGKVFLIRGAAARDQVLINSARLMFKMAESIDPDLREAKILLGLFKTTE